MRARTLKSAVCLGAGALLLIGGCTKKKSTSPVEEPVEPTLTVMQQYFPLDYGDSWTWEVIRDYWIPEEFVDGDSSLGEPFTDVNQNGRHDDLEPYEDLNDNQKYDGPNDPWTPPVPFADRNANGDYDAPNGYWNQGESFLDIDGNGVYSSADTLTLCATVSQSGTPEGLTTLDGRLLGTYSDGHPGEMWAELDLYSNDSLGLIWHGHIDLEDTRDFLGALCEPVEIAAAEPLEGEPILSTHCLFTNAGVISVLEGTEDVNVPAGDFENCLRFKLYATGWDWSMEKYNGVSYRWYAKDVGLVKSTGPRSGESRVLKSAVVSGVSYPGVP
jgi:hypothetical protein